MAISMTGYGRAEAVYATRRYLVEIKSVNNRFCDISVRMPRGYISLENKIREKISDRLLRGKIDVFVTIEDVGDGNQTVELNEGLAKAYSDAVKKVAELTGRDDDADAFQFARFPDVLVARANSLTPEEAGAELLPVLDGAIDDMVRMREIEGEKLVDDLQTKVDAFERYHAAILLRAPLVPQEYRERLMARMEELLDDKANLVYDEARREAEVAVFADKCAIDEELTRLSSHMTQLRETLRAKGSIGKRLDFILQEMNREVNTIGSKANDLTITNHVLDMKTELEKIREQIQNLV
ncbi:MAG: YicC family protein [Clostridiales bacterium]|nr:YicC family protein [Candidatus Scatonaster coprocaballi]